MLLFCSLKFLATLLYLLPTLKKGCKPQFEYLAFRDTKIQTTVALKSKIFFLNKTLENSQQKVKHVQLFKILLDIQTVNVYIYKKKKKINLLTAEDVDVTILLLVICLVRECFVGSILVDIQQGL